MSYCTPEQHSKKEEAMRDAERQEEHATVTGMGDKRSSHHSHMAHVAVDEMRGR
jgi:hypothetical protein